MRFTAKATRHARRIPSCRPPGATVTAAVSHRLLGVDEITLHVAEAGEGPAVVLLHGFPELSTWNRPSPTSLARDSPRCGHWVQQEQPQQVNHELVAFLDAHTTARHS
jgi:pimeloyl-ACP methyl ester carboxylesterase